jgi:2-aminoadipate transaminase
MKINDKNPEKSKRLGYSSIQTALKDSSNNDVISFALGMPSEDLFTISNYKNKISDLWERNALQYSPPLEALKQQIVTLMKHREVICTSSEICITTGAQQAIFLLSKLLAKNNDTAIVDNPTYPGFIEATRSLGINLLPVSLSFAEGIYPDIFETICAKEIKPKFFYTISEGHNPLGISLKKEKRLKLIDIARKYQVPIVEDDPYGFLNYEPIEPSLKSYDKDWVFYIGSFSKIFAPSVRVGWIVAPESVIKKLEILKAAIDVNTSTFSQRIVSAFLEMTDFDKHLLNIRDYYEKKRNKMTNSLREHIPQLKFVEPSSGFFIWGQLPSDSNAEILLSSAVNYKVAFLPGPVFEASPANTDSSNTLNHCLRLSFSHCPLELIEDGIIRLANAIKSY